MFMTYIVKIVIHGLHLDMYRGCGEQNLPAYGCCRLLLVNLYSYIKDKF